jgi:hypothetical protein
MSKGNLKYPGVLFPGSADQTVLQSQDGSSMCVAGLGKGSFGSVGDDEQQRMVQDFCFHLRAHQPAARVMTVQQVRAVCCS